MKEAIEVIDAAGPANLDVGFTDEEVCKEFGYTEIKTNPIDLKKNEYAALKNAIKTQWPLQELGEFDTNKVIALNGLISKIAIPGVGPDFFGLMRYKTANGDITIKISLPFSAFES